MAERTETRKALKQLGDGLLMRQATPDDAERVAELNAIADGSADEPNEEVRCRTLVMMSGSHTPVQPHDFTVVEDASTGMLVSSLCLMSETWSFDGLVFDVGRIELVNTHLDYRNRGLIRAQFEIVHEQSRLRGDKATVVFGIPWY